MQKEHAQNSVGLIPERLGAAETPKRSSVFPGFLQDQTFPIPIFLSKRKLTMRKFQVCFTSATLKPPNENTEQLSTLSVL